MKATKKIQTNIETTTQNAVEKKMKDKVDINVPQYIAVGRLDMTPFGLVARGNSPEEKSIPICDAFEVLGKTHDGRGNSQGVWIAWQDNYGFRHEKKILRGDISARFADVKRELVDGGLFIETHRGVSELLQRYLLMVDPPKAYISVSQVGWHGTAFVAHDGVFGANDPVPIVLDKESAETSARKHLGSLENWQSSIGVHAVQNSRLALAISAALAAPLIHPLNEETTGFHFVGESSSGKSTALRVGASVCGVEIRTWRSTDNAAEGLASQNNDGVLILDEMAQVEPKVADATVYMLGNGTGKARADRDGSAKLSKKWRIMLLSSGEIGLAEKLMEGGIKMKAGQAVRLIEIPADAGAGFKLFESLHGFADGDGLARHLRSATEQFQGVVFRAFLQHITTDLTAIVEELKGDIRSWIAQYLPSQSDGQVNRVAAKFALTAAAGELATRANILPWPDGEASRAAGICFQAWLSRRGGTGNYEESAALDQVQRFLETQGASRFSILHANDEVSGQRILNRAGWIKKHQDHHEFWCLPTVFKEEICKGMDAKVVANTLIKSGFMVVGSDGKTSKVQRIGGESCRVYCILGHIVGRA